jgi:hypothetical protein
MFSFLRGLPKLLWRATVFLAILAVLAQIGLALGAGGEISVEWRLVELGVTLVLLALPVGIAWRGKREGSLWYAGGGFVPLVSMGMT